MGNCKAVSTHFAAHFKLSAKSCSRSKEDIEKMSHVHCSSAIGSLMDAIVCTRPDWSHAVSVISHYMHDPGRDHWEAVKWILRSVKSSIDRGLVFDRNKAAT